jgi:hypothetical protein
MLESQIVRVIEESGLFASVAREPFDPGQVDLSIRIEPAIVAFDRRVNMAYFPLALATLTLYIWVGGPVATDTEFYDVTLKVADAGGRHAFDVSTHETHTHWISIYSSEYRGALCKGPNAGEATAGLVKDLAAKLASAGFAATGRDRPGAR